MFESLKRKPRPAPKEAPQEKEPPMVKVELPEVDSISKKLQEAEKEAERAHTGMIQVCTCGCTIEDCQIGPFHWEKRRKGC